MASSKSVPALLVLIGLAHAAAAAPAATPATPPATAPADDVPTLAAALESMTPPTPDPARLEDPAYAESFQAQRLQYETDRNDRIKALYDRFPDHPRARQLMLERWERLATFGQRKTVLAETDPALAGAGKPDWRLDLLYVRATASVWRPGPNLTPAAQAVEAFVQAASPSDPRAAELLFRLAEHETNPEKRTALYRRAGAESYGDSPYAAIARGRIVQVEGLGKPFDLSFTDAITGKPVSVQDGLKGKVVVVDFWSTSCPPCVAQMPQLKRLYAAYKDRGVEFIGVSLDDPESEGGLKALTDHVRRHEIPWPQYYQGDGPRSAFSRRWGVHAIPTIFVVDRTGRLASTTASGQLEPVLRQLLAAENGTPPTPAEANR